jgi:hypothetical protein
MKRLTPVNYGRAVPRRFRRPLTRREVRVFMSAADRAPLTRDLKYITLTIEELD